MNHRNNNLACVPFQQVVLPVNKDTYSEFIGDKTAYKAHVQAWIDAYPELFPGTIGDGWSLDGLTRESVKQGIRLRRIVTKADHEVWHIRPAFVMPYMTCDTATAEKILFLQKWASAWALAHTFEKDVMTIHRLTTHMGRDTIVGTTVKQADTLPKDVGADEKHSTLSGETVYLATTVAKQCDLGASVSVGAGQDELTEAYRQFQREAQQIQPDYQPETVNTDGWQATMNAWQILCPAIGLIQCFLHAILSLRHVAMKATTPLYTRIVEQAWPVDQAETKRSCSQRLRRLREWGETLKACPLKAKLVTLCQKKAGFLSAYDCPGCLRTSNMSDRLMRGMDKYLVAHQGFHGTVRLAEYGMRLLSLDKFPSISL